MATLEEPEIALERQIMDAVMSCNRLFGLHRFLCNYAFLQARGHLAKGEMDELSVMIGELNNGTYLPEPDEFGHYHLGNYETWDEVTNELVDLSASRMFTHFATTTEEEKKSGFFAHLPVNERQTIERLLVQAGGMLHPENVTGYQLTYVLRNDTNDHEEHHNIICVTYLKDPETEVGEVASETKANVAEVKKS